MFWGRMRKGDEQRANMAVGRKSRWDQTKGIAGYIKSVEAGSEEDDGRKKKRNVLLTPSFPHSLPNSQLISDLHLTGPSFTRSYPVVLIYYRHLANRIGRQSCARVFAMEVW